MSDIAWLVFARTQKQAAVDGTIVVGRLDGACLSATGQYLGATRGVSARATKTCVRASIHV